MFITSSRYTEAEIDDLIQARREELYARLLDIEVNFEDDQPFASSDDEPQINPELLQITKGYAEIKRKSIMKFKEESELSSVALLRRIHDAVSPFR